MECPAYGNLRQKFIFKHYANKTEPPLKCLLQNENMFITRDVGMVVFLRSRSKRKAALPSIGNYLNCWFLIISFFAASLKKINIYSTCHCTQAGGLTIQFRIRCDPVSTGGGFLFNQFNVLFRYRDKDGDRDPRR